MKPIIEIEILKTRPTLLDKWFWIVFGIFFFLKIGNKKT